MANGGLTHRFCKNLCWRRRGRYFEFRGEQCGLQAVLDSWRVLEVAIRLLEGGDRVITAEGCFHLGENLNIGRKLGVPHRVQIGKRVLRTSHRSVYSTNVSEECYLSELDRELGGLNHFVFEDLGAFRGVEKRIHVEVTEVDHWSSWSHRVDEDSVGVGEDEVQQVIL